MDTTQPDNSTYSPLPEGVSAPEPLAKNTVPTDAASPTNTAPTSGQPGITRHMFVKPHQYRQNAKGGFQLRPRFRTKKHRGAAKGAFGRKAKPESAISRALRDIQLPTE